MTTKKLILSLLALLAPIAAGAQEPYAVLSSDNKALTFYYDDQKASRNGMDVGPFNGYPDDYPSWYDQRGSITSVVFDASFTSCTTLTSTAWWFFDLRNLSSITGISNLKTDNVTNMYYMFSHCRSLTSLDVSGFKTENVEYMGGMFSGCSGLTTIYAGEGWSTAKVKDSRDMFAGCTGLVGGAGTKFDACNIDHTYARIDGGSDNPGYFTRKAGDTGEWAEGDLNHDGKLDAADIVHLTNLILNQK